MSAFKVAYLVHCNGVLTLTNSIVLNHSSVASIALRRTVSSVYTLSSEISDLILGANVVDYLLAVGETVFIGIRAVCRSESTNANALTDLSEVTTVETNTATSI